jgi:Ca-activated chloride channel family protein
MVALFICADQFGAVHNLGTFMLHLSAKVALSALMALVLQQTIRLDVSLVTVGARVTDSRGRDVRGLKAEDFVVTEDGVPQRISFFSDEPQAITLGIVFDRSSSMEANQKIDRAKDAAQALVKVARDGSEFFFIGFNEKVRVVTDFTFDRQEVLSAVAKTEPDGSTSLYDAILEGLTMGSRARLPRQVLVIISDGADQHSTHELREIIDIVRDSATQIYTIGYFSKEEEQLFRSSAEKFSLTNGAEVDNPRLALRRIAEESGALSFFPRSDEELVKAVAQISEDLVTQYSLGFSPPAGDDKTYRQLNVNIKGDRYQIRSRPGYGVREFSRGSSRPKGEGSLAHEMKVERRDGRVVYREDFKDSSSGWPERESARYIGDGYRLSGNDIVVSAGPELKNFKASLSVLVEDTLPPSNPLPRVGERALPTTGIPANPAGGGLVFRHTGSSYYALIIYPPNGLRQGLAVVMHSNTAKPTEMARWPLLNRPSIRRDIQVRCVQRVCEFSEGGAVLGRLNNVAVESGRLGLILSAKGAASFQNLNAEEMEQ